MSTIGRKASWLVGVGVVVALGGFVAYRGFTMRIERLTDTQVWVYGIDGKSVAQALDVEVRFPGAPLSQADGPPAGAYQHALSLQSDASGHVTLLREQVRKAYVPMPHGAGPMNYEQRFSLPNRVDQSTPPTHGARAAHLVIENGRILRSLFFVNQDDNVRDDDAFYAKCARSVEAFAAAETYVDGPTDAAFGKRVRQRLFERAKMMGMIPVDEAANEFARGFVSIEIARAPAVHCSMLVWLFDSGGNAPPGFDKS